MRLLPVPLVQVDDRVIGIEAVMPLSGHRVSIFEESVVVPATLSRHDIDDPGVHVSVFGFWNTGYHRDFLDRCAVHARETYLPRGGHYSPSAHRQQYR